MQDEQSPFKKREYDEKGRRCGEGMVFFFSFLSFVLAGFSISCVVDQLRGGIIPPPFVSRPIVGYNNIY